jgi:hypothetical protein
MKPPSVWLRPPDEVIWDLTRGFVLNCATTDTALVPICCENHMKRSNTMWAASRDLIYKNAVRTSQETLRLRYRAQPVNAV